MASTRPNNVICVKVDDNSTGSNVDVVHLESSATDESASVASQPYVRVTRVPKAEFTATELASLEKGLRSTTVNVILNPFCGFKRARACYDTVVEPLLAYAGLNVELHETTCHGDGIRLGRQLRAASRKLYLVVLAGDGTIGELLNGLGFEEDGKFGWPQDELQLCIVPQGTANALYHSVFRPPSSPATTDATLASFRSLVAFIRQSSQVCSLNVALNSLHCRHASLQQVLTTVVTSTALHASLLHDAEALRATVPGLERFKMAAMQNVSRWNNGRLSLHSAEDAPIQQYDLTSKTFRTTSSTTDLVLDGPFVYLVTALVDRFEPTFVVAPCQALPGSNVALAPARPVIDVIVIRPLRHAATAQLYAQALTEQKKEQIRQGFAQQLWAVTGGMYGGGTHIDMVYEDEPLVSIVEYYRCERVTWEPATENDIKTRLVCLDGALEDLGPDGKLDSRVLDREDGKGVMIWM